MANEELPTTWNQNISDKDYPVHSIHHVYDFDQVIFIVVGDWSLKREWGAMTSPALMVLYSNDAVEVRYVDQSCLQVAPCGSTFVHHESPKEVIHPAHGMCLKVIFFQLKVIFNYIIIQSFFCFTSN